MLNKTYSLRPHCVSCWTTYIHYVGHHINKFLSWFCFVEHVIGSGQSNSEIRNLDLVIYSFLFADNTSMQDSLRLKYFRFFSCSIKKCLDMLKY